MNGGEEPEASMQQLQDSPSTPPAASVRACVRRVRQGGRRDRQQCSSDRCVTLGGRHAGESISRSAGLEGCKGREREHGVQPRCRAPRPLRSQPPTTATGAPPQSPPALTRVVAAKLEVGQPRQLAEAGLQAHLPAYEARALQPLEGAIYRPHRQVAGRLQAELAQAARHAHQGGGRVVGRLPLGHRAAQLHSIEMAERGGG